MVPSTEYERGSHIKAIGVTMYIKDVGVTLKILV